MKLEQRFDRILKDLDRLAKDCLAACVHIDALQDKVACQRAIKALEAARASIRLQVFEVQDLDKVSA
jgi:ribosome-binding factor A